MKLSRRKIALVTPLVILAACGIGFWVHHVRLKSAVEAYKQQLRAAGEKLTVDEWVPRPIPAEQNSVGLFQQAMPGMTNRTRALDMNRPTPMRLAVPGRAIVGWSQPDVETPYFGTNTWNEVLEGLDAEKPSREILAQIIDRPDLQFDLDYHGGVEMFLTHLSPLETGASRFSAAAVCDLHRGDPFSATTDARVILALVKATRHEPIVLSQLLRISIATIGFNVTWEILHAPGITDQELAALQRDWTDLDFTTPAEKALEMERASTLATINEWRSSDEKLRQINGPYAAPGWPPATTGTWLDGAKAFIKDGWTASRLRAGNTAWRYEKSYPDELQMLEGFQVLITTLREVKTNGSFQVALRHKTASLTRLGFKEHYDSENDLESYFDLNTFFRRFTPEAAFFIDRILQAEVAQQMAITAISLERYRLRNGQYPADLTALVPDLVPRVPEDPVDGLPLRYRLEGNRSFLLYSIGSDEVDDGGNPAPEDKSKPPFWANGRDWVWPRPATPEEIAAFYAHTNAAAKH
jgi:hypothetical protein